MSDAGRPGGPADQADPGAAGPEGPGDHVGHEPVGSVGEEAAKLFGALSDWARTQGVPGATGGDAEVPEDQPGRPADPVAQAREALAHGLHEVGEHLATGSAECRYCPVCQVIHVVRQTSPEVRAHLTAAAGSLLQAAAGLMAPPQPASGSRGPVERIDLDGDGDGEGDAAPPGGRPGGPGAASSDESDEGQPGGRP